jgi:UDPglucose 6-dehydrogenase
MQSIVTKAKKMLGDDLTGKKIGVLGLAFKPDTDDMRDAPAVVIIKSLVAEGATIQTYDPVALENGKRILKDVPEVKFTTDVYETAKDADLLIVVTEWNEFKEINLTKIKELMAKPNLIDGRNIYEPEKVKALGFTYFGVGR